MALTIDRAALESFMGRPDGPLIGWLTRKAIEVETEAKRLSPVDTGRLKGSITHLVSKDDVGPYALVGTNVEYGLYQEFGTWKMAAQPFLRPALQKVMSK